MIVDGDKQELPPSTVDPVPGISGNAVTHAYNSAQLLGIDMQQIAGMLVLVAHARRTRRQIRPSRQTCPRQDSTDGAFGYAQTLRDPGMGQEAAAQLHDRQGGMGGDRTRTSLRSRRRIAQPRLALGQVTTQPFTHGRHADVVLGGRGGVSQLAREQVLDHFQSTDDGESGILVDVHPAELLKDAEWVAPSSLSDSAWMNSNNVLKLHN